VNRIERLSELKIDKALVDSLSLTSAYSINSPEGRTLHRK